MFVFAWGAHAPPGAGFGASPKHSFKAKCVIARARSPAREARALPGNARAFTLIELLVVIVILAVLAGLAFPVFQSVQNSARKTQARNDVTQIVTAVNAFYTEYGKYPIATDDTPLADNADLSYALRAVASGANIGDAINSRKIAFLNVPDARDQASPRSGIKSSDGRWYDPWGSTYKIAIDGTYDNQLANPYGPMGGAGSDPLRQGVIAWSFGKNGRLGGGAAGPGFDQEPGTADKFTSSGDVISWQ
jgi:prepilin-type N-terminal cleavage/methylation domain-containing protein